MMTERYNHPKIPGTRLRDASDVAASLVLVATGSVSVWAAWAMEGSGSLSAIFAALGVFALLIAAIVVFVRPILNVQDFWGGLVLLMLAIIALYATSDLSGMRGFSFGPGTAPRLFAVLLGMFGILIVLSSLFNEGPNRLHYAARGPLLVTLSIVLFAALIQPLGLVMTSFIMFLFAASGSRETRWREAVIAAACLTGFCVLLFIYLLDLSFPLWPRLTILGHMIAFR